MATVKTQASRSHSVPRLDAMASVGSMPVRAPSSNELSQLSSQRRGDILEENLLQVSTPHAPDPPLPSRPPFCDNPCACLAASFTSLAPLLCAQAAILASEVEFATSKKEECKPAYEALEVDATPSFSEIFG